VGGAFSLDGRPVPFEDGDTVASAAYRAGVRTFTRSLKSHRRRGLYCNTGDCANCLVTIDGVPGERACVTRAREDARVRRETGWPSAERDLLGVADHLHWAMPVAFYSKTFIRPRFAWRIAERAIRRATGTGSLPASAAATPKRARFERADVLVIGGGVAGLSAAAAAREADDAARVILVDEDEPGARVAPGPDREAIDRLAVDARATGVAVWTHHTAIGIYEGRPSVVVVGPDALVEIEARRVVVATGALEAHAVFPGNDLPGVWLGRGAARIAGVHGVRLGDHAVVVSANEEGDRHAEVLRASGIDVTALRGEVLEARGSTRLREVTIETPEGRRSFACDALVLSLGWAPRDALLRMSADEPVVGAGDAVQPGRPLEDAIESGRLAGAGEEAEAASDSVTVPDPGRDGYLCVCEDVTLHDLERAWDEGWRSSEILKRYTTATMGPCQGALCARHLARLAEARGAAPAAAARTTARPPVRGPRLEELVGRVHEAIARRTALHDRHVSASARIDRSGEWLRPGTYGDTAGEIRAVRERVSVMDVSTLGKFLIAGRDAVALLDEIFPIDVARIRVGRARYVVALDEAGYVFDDGLLGALPDDRFVLTTTSGGADRMEAWLRDRADGRALHVHIANLTVALGAIIVAGPHARDLLARRSDDDLSRDAIPYPGVADVTVAGVPCRAIAPGFVGELAFELHHPAGRSVELWDALLEAGTDWEIRPHGLDALDVLRLEKGHPYLGQDVLPDDHPAKLGLAGLVANRKERFVGRTALARFAALPLERSLVGLRFDTLPRRGTPLTVEGRIVGRVTSCTDSTAVGAAIGLGWIRAVDGALPTELRAGSATATVVPTPFYDPTGARLRA
jgi:sarcosine oxidase subunit alpha